MEIDNSIYFIFADNLGYHREPAKVVYESMNMTMISFEGDEQKWRSINKWTSENCTK